MKKLLSATVAFSLLASAGVAGAQSYDRHDGRHDGRRAVEQQFDGHRGDDRRGDQRWGDQRWSGHRFDGGRYQRPAGYRHHEWRRGERLPYSYRSSAYRVDYHRYGLRAPPRGYQYSRVDNDVVLTALATGVIAAVIVDAFDD